MNCARENELLDALGRGYLGAELETHVAACEECRELRSVAGALLDDRADAIRHATVPAAGTMWWRMQVRRRHDAIAAARRSLLIGQAATLLIAIALVVRWFGADVAGEVSAFAASFHVSMPVLVGVAMWALAIPIAGWVAIRSK